MARVCQVTGKRPMTGNNVSHANNRTKRRFMPNLQYRRFWIEGENRWVRLRVTNAALRTIDKLGIDVVLADLRKRGARSGSCVLVVGSEGRGLRRLVRERCTELVRIPMAAPGGSVRSATTEGRAGGRDTAP